MNSRGKLILIGIEEILEIVGCCVENIISYLYGASVILCTIQVHL